MYISQNILFYLLSHRYPIVYDKRGQTTLSIRSASLFKDYTQSQTTLYIVPEDELLSFYFYYGHAWIFLLSPQSDFIIPERFKPYCAVIHEPISPLELLETVFSFLVDLQTWDGILKDMIAHSQSYTDLFTQFQKVLPCPMILIDKDFKVVSYSRDFFRMTQGDPASDTNKVPMAIIKELIDNKEFRECEKNRSAFLFLQPPEPVRLCFNICHDDNYLARFIYYPNTPDPTAGEYELFSYIGQYIQDTYVRYFDTGELKSPNDSMHHMCRILLSENDGDPCLSADQERILRSYGWEQTDIYQVYSIRYTSFINFQPVAKVLQQELEDAWPFSCAILEKDELVWIVNHTKILDTDNDFHESFISVIRDNICKAGISNSFSGLHHLRKYYEQAQIALRIGTDKNPHFWSYAFKDYFMEYVCEKLNKDFSPEQLVHPGIYKLMRSDASRDTAYIDTIIRFIQRDFNVSQTANDLYMHRTTLLKKLDKIRSIAGIRFDDPKDLLFILLSLQLLDLL